VALSFLAIGHLLAFVEAAPNASFGCLVRRNAMGIIILLVILLLLFAGGGFYYDLHSITMAAASA
jgi:hypothetical protein